MTTMFFEKGRSPNFLRTVMGVTGRICIKFCLSKEVLHSCRKNTEEKLKKHLRKTQEKLKCSGSFSSVFFRGRFETYKALYFKHIH